MRLVQSAPPHLYTWQSWCPNCGAIVETRAEDLIWLRTDQNKRGKPEVFWFKCPACRERVIVSTAEYKSLPKLVVGLAKNPPPKPAAQVPEEEGGGDEE